MGDIAPLSGLALLLDLPGTAGLLTLGAPPAAPTSTRTNDPLAQSLAIHMDG